MKRIILAPFVTFTFLMLGFTANAQTAWDGSSVASWTKGSGTETNPYQIETAEHLAYLTQSTKDWTNYKDEYFILANNIDLGGKEWMPIGLDKDEAFRGNFDGNGKTIANLYIKSTTLKYAGLFGYIHGGEIKNLGIVGEVVYLLLLIMMIPMQVV